MLPCRDAGLNDANNARVVEDLIEDINTDKQVALDSLARPAYREYAKDPAFRLD